MSRRILSLVLMVFLILSVSYAQVGKFKDVPSNHWAAEAVKYLTDLGIISGIRPDTFAGDLYVTRYQAAVLLYKLIQALQSGKIVLPAADVSELKDLVSQLQDELQLIGANVEDLMNALQDLDSRVSDLEAAISEKVGVEDVENIVSEALADVNARIDDLEAAIAAIEKVEVTPEQIEAVVGDKLEQLIESKMEELTGRVTDLEGFVTDLDSRLADVEAALVDKPSLDEVEAMIEEKLGAIEVPDVEELTGRVTDLEDRVSAVETRLEDVDSAISDIMSSVDDLNANLVDLSGKVDEVLALKDQLDELILRIEAIQGIEVPVELDEMKSFIMDLDSRLTELSTSVDDLNTVVADLQSQIDDVNSKIEQVNTNVDNINSSIEALSTSVDDLFVLNDGVSTRLDETVNRLVALEEKVATLEGKVVADKNFALNLRFTTKVDLATRNPVNTLTTQLAFNLTPNVKLVLQSVSSANANDMAGGVDVCMPISKDITGVAGASYDNGKFSVYGGVKLAMLKNAVIDVIVGVPDVMALGSGELKDTVSLKLGVSYKLTDKVSFTGYVTNLEDNAAAANLALVYAVDPKADLSLGLYLYGLGNLIGGNFDAVQKSVVFSAGASF